MTPESTNALDLIKNQLGFGSLHDIQNKAKNLAASSKSDVTSAAAKGTVTQGSAAHGVSTPGTAAQGAGGLSNIDKKRWKASLDFEAMFLSQMYKSMRQNTTGEDLTEASPGREIFTEMLDNQYAGMHSKSPVEAGEQGLKNAINGRSNSMAAQIYRAMARSEGPEVVSSLPTAGSSLPTVTPSLPSSRPLSVPGIAGAPADPIPQEKLDPVVSLAAQTYGVDTNLIKGVIKTESNNRPQAVSSAGAKGLMQLMDTTSQDLGVRNPFNAHENVLGGTRYLKQLLDRYQGDVSKALAAYNAGPGAVDRFGGIPPYPETQDYVKKVLAAQAAFTSEATLNVVGN